MVIPIYGSIFANEFIGMRNIDVIESVMNLLCSV